MSWHPIEDAEIPYLEALGSSLQRARCSRAMTQRELATAAQLSMSTIQRIEAGTRRTRRTTLARIADALGDPELADVLAELAGPALGLESPYAERIARRRERRHRKAQRRDEWAASRRDQGQARQQRAEAMAAVRELARIARDYERLGSMAPDLAGAIRPDLEGGHRP